MVNEQSNVSNRYGEALFAFVLINK